MKSIKKRILISVGIMAALAVVAVSFFFVKDYLNCRRYTENMLNRSVYGTFDNMIEMNAMLEKIVNQGYVLETELLVLNEMYTAYISNFYDYEYITEQLTGFAFNTASENQEYTFENMDFYNRCRDLFDEKEYKISDIKYELNDKQLEIFRSSLQYTQTAVAIIRQNIEYYNAYEVKYSEEDSKEGIMIHSEYQYKQEYLKPWGENTTGAAATVWIDGSIQPVEVPPYDYPKKPKLTVRDDVWYRTMQELKQLNIKEK